MMHTNARLKNWE